MNVVAGDVNRGGAVLADDVSDVKRRFFSATSGPASGSCGYSLFRTSTGPALCSRTTFPR
jgi:hypothetical protein